MRNKYRAVYELWALKFLLLVLSKKEGSVGQKKLRQYADYGEKSTLHCNGSHLTRFRLSRQMVKEFRILHRVIVTLKEHNSTKV